MISPHLINLLFIFNSNNYNYQVVFHEKYINVYGKHTKLTIKGNDILIERKGFEYYMKTPTIGYDGGELVFDGEDYRISFRIDGKKDEYKYEDL